LSRTFGVVQGLLLTAIDRQLGSGVDPASHPCDSAPPPRSYLPPGALPTAVPRARFTPGTCHPTGVERTSRRHTTVHLALAAVAGFGDRPLTAAAQARNLNGALAAGSVDPVRGRGIEPRPSLDPADTRIRVVRAERLVVPDGIDFDVPGAAEHQVTAPGLRHRDPVQAQAAEHRVGRVRQPDPGAVAEGLHDQARAVVALAAAGPPYAYQQPDF
jgi:hypothetical protein